MSIAPCSSLFSVIIIHDFLKNINTLCRVSPPSPLRSCSFPRFRIYSLLVCTEKLAFFVSKVVLKNFSIFSLIFAAFLIVIVIEQI